MSDSALIPPIRDEIVLRKAGSRVLAEDPIRRVRVPIDQLCLDVIEALDDGPKEPDVLCGRVGGHTLQVRERVALLARHVLLSTASAARQVEVSIEAAQELLTPDEGLHEAPLRVPEDISHRCQASGACCSETDVGPLSERDLVSIDAVDWREHLPAERRELELLDRVPFEDGEVVLTAMTCGHCVFLDADSLCTIHRVGGADRKPAVCQQFPFMLIRTPRGIDVSYATECRSWVEARGAPVGEGVIEGEVRHLLARGASVLDVPLPVAVWDGLDIGFSEWRALQKRCLAGIRRAGDLAGLVDAVVEPVLALLGRHNGRVAAEEVFLEPARWGLADDEPEPAAARFDACRDAVQRKMGGLIAELAASYADDEDGYLDRIFREMGEVLPMVLAGKESPEVLRYDGEIEVWRDMALAALYGHEPARRQYLLTGASNLVFRLLMAHRMAGHRARMGLRTRTTVQDAVDSMVLITKMLRGTALLGELNKPWEEFIELFLFNAGALTRAAPPILPKRGDGRWLPGAL